MIRSTNSLSVAMLSVGLQAFGSFYSDGNSPSTLKVGQIFPSASYKQWKFFNRFRFRYFRSCELLIQHRKMSSPHLYVASTGWQRADALDVDPADDPTDWSLISDPFISISNTLHNKDVKVSEQLVAKRGTSPVTPSHAQRTSLSSPLTYWEEICILVDLWTRHRITVRQFAVCTNPVHGRASVELLHQILIRTASSSTVI
jgi:hypothetical protein